MSLVDQVRQNIDEECLARRCRREGCSLTLESLAHPFLLIDMDHERSPSDSSGGKNCDYIFIGDKENWSWIAPLELKRGKLHAKDVVAQIQAGATVADQIVPHEVRTRFRPVAAYGGKAHRAELRLLTTSRVRFRSQNNRVALVRCGTSLLGALNKRT